MQRIVSRARVWIATRGTQFKSYVVAVVNQAWARINATWTPITLGAVRTAKHARAWIGAHCAQFKRDTWDAPTIGPSAAAVLSSLVGLVAWLTDKYGSSNQPRGGVPCQLTTGGVITEWEAFVTIGFMTLVAWSVGTEPFVTRKVGDWWWASGQRRFASSPSMIRQLATLFTALVYALFKIPSVTWSVADYVLARPVATVIGATRRGARARYSWFFGLISAVVLVGILGPPEIGQWAIVFGLVAVVSIIRRWSWIEADRDTFLLERGERDDKLDRRPTREQFLREAVQSGACLVVIGLVLWGASPSSTWLPMPVTAYLVAAPALVCVIVLGLAVAGLWQDSWLDPGASAFRIKFKEDLRDEAMVALPLIFVLIPLGLDCAYLVSLADGHPAFQLCDGSAMPNGLRDRFVVWLGYFGAELFKTVPFVDWSEVFHVENGSRIEPLTGNGKQIAFALRAGLDLLFLAAVVQAVNIAGRLREQWSAFNNNRLPILEPFTEAPIFFRAGNSIEEALDIRPTDQHAIACFPAYDAAPLRSLIENKEGKLNDLAEDVRYLVQKAAAAMLARQHPGEETDEFLFARVKVEHGPLRDWVQAVGSGVVPERTMDDDVDRRRLHNLMVDPIAAAPVRAAAARRLGRMSSDKVTVELLMKRSCDAREDESVRADAGVSLAKLEPTNHDVRRCVEALPQIFRGRLLGQRLLPAMATAYALARIDRDATPGAIAARFVPDLRAHAERAASVQIEPMGIDAARGPKIDLQTEQMVHVTPGKEPFAKTFLMGSSDYDDDRRERPQTSISMERAFAAGRFPVTNREYIGFTDSMGLERLAKWHDAHHPAVEVTWHRAYEYAGWLERITGERYRLLYEAEWEYICRAGTTSRFWWGQGNEGADKWDAKYGNLRDPLGQITPVNAYPVNPWGFWDLYGNVYEWCADHWHETLQGRPHDGTVWLASADGDRPERRVVRGGSWSYPPPVKVKSAAYRNRQVATYVGTQNGFRLARTLGSRHRTIS